MQFEVVQSLDSGVSPGKAWELETSIGDEDYDAERRTTIKITMLSVGQL